MPLSVWGARGYDVSMIENNSEDKDKEHHLVLGWTYRVKTRKSLHSVEQRSLRQQIMEGTAKIRPGQSISMSLEAQAAGSQAKEQIAAPTEESQSEADSEANGSEEDGPIISSSSSSSTSSSSSHRGKKKRSGKSKGSKMGKKFNKINYTVLLL